MKAENQKDISGVSSAAAEKFPACRVRRRMVIMLLAFLAVFLASFSVGRFFVPADKVLLIIFNSMAKLLGLGELEKSWTSKMEIVVLQVRMPRIIAACFVGAALSSAGAVYQGMFRNPMVSPDILGSSQGAGFGAALAIIIGFGTAGTSAFSFVGGIIAVAVALLAASRYKNNPVLGLVLAGIMVGSLFSAGTSFLKLVADPTDELPAITYWLMGSLASIRASHLLLLCPCVLVGLAPLMLLRWRLNVITLGEEQARSLGVNTKLLRRQIVLCATLMSGA